MPGLGAIDGNEEGKAAAIREGEVFFGRLGLSNSGICQGALVHHQVSRTEEVLNNVLKICGRW